MSRVPRSPHIHHCTSEPLRFFGRQEELRLLNEAVHGGTVSVVALIGPGGQGKTATVQHWLQHGLPGPDRPEGVFLWSFYRGKDSDLCLRELLAYAEQTAPGADLAASYCVDHLLPRLRRERWAIILDGLEVVQHEEGPWFGRPVHPELGRLVEELATEPMPGVVVVTSRFPLPGLERRRHARVVHLSGLDDASARGLLRSLGVQGSDAELDAAARACGHHAKAIELLGTYLVAFRGGRAADWEPGGAVPTDQEACVIHVLAAFQETLPAEQQDLVTLATAFHHPPTEAKLLDYLRSPAVHTLLHATWQRAYVPFRDRPGAWLPAQIEHLLRLRLLERVAAGDTERVIDAHPLVRRAFEPARGAGGTRETARARAGFLHSRPDRRKPATLAEAWDVAELFHAHCEAALWSEADDVLVGLDNPKHRFLAPAFERDLLLRFFPAGDWRQPPLWSGFGRYRSLAICFEMLGEFEAALAAYRESDAALRGDAWIALGRLQPLLGVGTWPQPWQSLGAAYRCHALTLAGRTAEALALARTLVPVDIYEWVHVFECYLRTGTLAGLDLRALLYRPQGGAVSAWTDLAQERLQADHARLTSGPSHEMQEALTRLVEAYDRAGLPFERALTRLSLARVLMALDDREAAASTLQTTRRIAGQYRMAILEVDAWEMEAELAGRLGQPERQAAAAQAARALREQTGYRGPTRP